MRVKKTIIFTIAIIILGLPLAVASAFLLAYSGKVYPKTKIVDINISGLTKKEAEKNISEEVKRRLSTKISLVFENQTWEIPLSDINFVYNSQKTAEKAFETSRLRPVKNWFTDKNIGLEFSLNENSLKEGVATVAASLNRPTIPTEILLDRKTKQIIITEGKPGREIDLDNLIGSILMKIAYLDLDQPIPLPIKKNNGLPDERQKEAAKQRAEKLIGKNITLASNQQNFILAEEQLINFVDFFNQWNEEKIDEYIETLAQSVEKSAQSALFQFENGKVIAFQPDKPGYKLDKPETKKRVQEALDEVIVKNDNAIKELPVKELPPGTKTSDTNRLGITELVAEGESFFFHSIPSRIHNIDLASSKLHGVLIAPGETFSINSILGDISKATGYQDAYIIQNGRTILGAGGGVCQVSTTLFRAALNAGLPVIERHPHAYRVSYYEYNTKAGFDAGVFSPTADLKFKNDTGNHLLIQRKFDEKNHYLVFQFYGRPDGRTVEITNSRVWDISSPPEDLYIDDPTLPAGMIKQIDFKAWGAKAAFDWKVTKDGQTLHQQTFYSAYQPWRAIFLKGTKTN